MHELVKRHSIVIAGVLLAACASPQPPTRELKSASGAIRAAQEMEADEFPQASLHLVLARESLAKAERLIADEKMESAKVLLARARADAELALVLARVEKTRFAARRVARQVAALERETARRAAR